MVRCFTRDFVALVGTAFPSTATGPVAETAAACRKLLVAQGWQPDGKAGDTLFFKPNAIRLTVSITAAPALDGKTSVSFSSEQLSADLPAPADTVQLQYADTTKQVLFDSKESEDAIVSQNGPGRGSRVSGGTPIASSGATGYDSEARGTTENRVFLLRNAAVCVGHGFIVSTR